MPTRTQTYNQNLPFNTGFNSPFGNTQPNPNVRGRGSIQKDLKGSDKKNKKDNDDNNRGGGLLEPIIEDIGGWIQRRRQT